MISKGSSEKGGSSFLCANKTRSLDEALSWWDVTGRGGTKGVSSIPGCLKNVFLECLVV